MRYIFEKKSEKYIRYSIQKMDSDSITVTFFYDLIELEIKATNLFKDLNLKSSLKPVETLDEFYKREKYMHYPLQQIYCKSLIDLYGNSIPSPGFGRNSRMSMSHTQELSRFCTTKIPPFVRYSVDMVLGEFEKGNILESSLSSRLRYVKDLPFVSFEEMKFL
jgi:hypothetical protein